MYTHFQNLSTEREILISVNKPEFNKTKSSKNMPKSRKKYAIMLDYIQTLFLVRKYVKQGVALEGSILKGYRSCMQVLMKNV